MPVRRGFKSQSFQTVLCLLECVKVSVVIASSIFVCTFIFYASVMQVSWGKPEREEMRACTHPGRQAGSFHVREVHTCSLHRL